MVRNTAILHNCTYSWTERLLVMSRHGTADVSYDATHSLEIRHLVPETDDNTFGKYFTEQLSHLRNSTGSTFKKHMKSIKQSFQFYNN